MRFKAGKSGNPKGRPKGAKNIAKADLLEKFQVIVNMCTEKLCEHIEELSVSELLKAAVGLASYILPKQQSIDINQQVTTEYQELKKLLDEMPDELVERVANKIEYLHNLSAS